MIETCHVFQHAIVRLPGINFAQGLSTVHLGVPLYDKVLQQHAHYCEALRECGLTLTTLDADLGSSRLHVCGGHSRAHCTQCRADAARRSQP